MIEAKELRTGNYVIYHGEVEETCKLDAEDIFLTETKEGYRQLHSPIPLTPDILEKAGFHYNNNRSSVARREIAYQDSDYPCSLQLSGSGICIARSGIGAITAPVFYLHQLQNLFYALTGEELTINL